MRTTTCFYSSAAALHRVFIAPIERPHLPLRHTLRLFTPPIQNHRNFPSIQHRNVATSAPADKRRPPQNDEINARSVILVNPDNSLSDPQPLSSVLRNLDREKHILFQITPAPSLFEPALCKLIDKKKAYAKAKNAKKSSAAPTKSLELNWAIEGGDLEHRVRRFREFLEKGMKVEIAIAPKRRGKKATPEEAEELLRVLRKVVFEVDGARESKEMDGEVGKDVKFFAEGTVKVEKKEKEKRVKKVDVVGEEVGGERSVAWSPNS